MANGTIRATTATKAKQLSKAPSWVSMEFLVWNTNAKAEVRKY